MTRRRAADAAAVLVVSDRGRVLRLPLAEVLYLKAELKYVTLRTAAPQPTCSTTRSADLEQRLGEGFLRVHRNALVATLGGACAAAPPRRRRRQRPTKAHAETLGRAPGAPRRMAGGVAPPAGGGARGAASLNRDDASVTAIDAG